MIWKNQIASEEEKMALQTGFRRIMTWSSDLSASSLEGRIILESRWARQAATHHQVDSQRKSRQSRLSDGRLRSPVCRNHVVAASIRARYHRL